MVENDPKFFRSSNFLYFGMKITLLLQNAFSPSMPNSVPYPLSFKPENGTRGSRAPCSFIQAVPTCSFRAILVARAMSLDQTEPPRPVLVSLAREMTSSSFFQESKGTIGA
jgi:hypothetical protein